LQSREACNDLLAYMCNMLMNVLTPL